MKLIVVFAFIDTCDSLKDSHCRHFCNSLLTSNISRVILC